MGTIIRTADKKNYMIKTGSGTKSSDTKNATSLEDAKKKIDAVSSKK